MQSNNQDSWCVCCFVSLRGANHLHVLRLVPPLLQFHRIHVPGGQAGRLHQAGPDPQRQAGLQTGGYPG